MVDIKRDWDKLSYGWKILLAILIVLSFLLLVSIILSISISLSMFSSLRIVFGSVFVLFLPGFIISFIFFPKTKPFEDEKAEEKEKGSLDLIERIALSFALSIAVVPLVVFYLNLAGLKINALNSFLTIAGIIIIAVFILYFKSNRVKNNPQ